jgi:hypothetical protein
VTSPSEPRSPPPPRADGGRPGLAAAAAWLGCGLLVVVSARYRLDRTLCAAWPPRAVGFAYAAVYFAAIFALSWAWRRTRVPWVALAAHAIAIFAAPFLSSDPLMYAAIGRALAGGASAATPLATALGADHPFLTPLPEAWRMGTSAYGPTWNLLASTIGHWAGGDLALALRLHQLAAAGAMALAALVSARTFGRSAFALVLLCPLAIVEATVGAHNDALLAPLVAAGLAFYLRGSEARALFALLLAVPLKASAAVFFGPAALAMALGRFALPRTRRLVTGLVVVLGIASLALLPLLAGGPLDAISRLVERPDVPFDHCTRSLECLPRVLFRFVLHLPTAAWATGLVFRGLGIAWLGWCALRSSESSSREEAARWLAAGLFVYFLVLHGWAQSWYLLPIVPALPLFEKDTRFGPGLRLYTITAVAYYGLVLPMSCLTDPITIAVSDLIEASITFFPPVVLLLRSRSRP